MLEALKQRVKEIQSSDVDRIDALSQPKQYDKESQQDNRSVQNKEQEKNIKKTKFVDDQQQRDDWDKSVLLIMLLQTVVDDQKLSVEERLAKHIAEEILKKNKHLRGFHSKQSLKRVLEMDTH